MMNFHLQISHFLQRHHQRSKDEVKGVPKGCVAVLVGIEAEEKLQRFVIPIVYVNHPLFLQLLNEAEEVYGFDHKGLITIPCHVEVFRNVQRLIDQEKHIVNHRHHHHHGRRRGGHHLLHNFLCFKA